MLQIKWSVFWLGGRGGVRSVGQMIYGSGGRVRG